MLATTLLLGLMALETIIVVKARAAREDHIAHRQDATRELSGATPSAIFHDEVTAGFAEATTHMHVLPAELIAPPPPANPEPPPVELAMLQFPHAEGPETPGPEQPSQPSAPELVPELPFLPASFDAQPPPWLGPDLKELLAAGLPPMSESLDAREGPWIADPAEIIVASLAPSPHAFDWRPAPQMPAPAPPMLEPHMEATEDWITRSLLNGHPGAQKVRFASNVESRCLPSTLLNVLYDAAVHFGDINVISGFRSRQHNRSVGGARRSLHLECRAIDFFAMGAGKPLVKWLKARKDVGGYKRYPFGSFHIDNGPRRSW